MSIGCGRSDFREEPEGTVKTRAWGAGAPVDSADHSIHSGLRRNGRSAAKVRMLGYKDGRDHDSGALALRYLFRQGHKSAAIAASVD
jgi:hypothetical protein